MKNSLTPLRCMTILLTALLCSIVARGYAEGVNQYTLQTLPKKCLLLLSATSGGVDKRKGDRYYLTFNKINSPMLVFTHDQSHEAGLISSKTVLKNWQFVFKGKQTEATFIHAYIKGKDLYGKLHPIAMELGKPFLDKLGNWRFPLSAKPGDHVRFGTYTAIDVLVQRNAD